MKGKIVRVLFVVAVLSLMLAPASVAAPPGATTMVVQSPLGLNVRTGSRLIDPVVIVLRNGETVTVYGEAVWNQGIRWVQVAVSRWGRNYEGWCSSAYLANYPGYDEPTDAFTGKGYKVIAPGGVRLRTAPGLKSTVMRIVPYGTILRRGDADPVLADGYTWRQLKFNNQLCWAAGEFLQYVNVPSP